MYIADALIDQPHIVWLVMENVPILSFNSLSVCVAVLITGISCLIIIVMLLLFAFCNKKKNYITLQV